MSKIVFKMNALNNINCAAMYYDEILDSNATINIIAICTDVRSDSNTI